LTTPRILNLLYFMLGVGVSRVMKTPVRRQPLAFLLVHGIGATRRHSMMDGIIHQLARIRPNWHFDNHFESHAFAREHETVVRGGDTAADRGKPDSTAAPTDLRHEEDGAPRINLRKGQVAPHDDHDPVSRRLYMADAYWGDISLVREGWINTVGGLLVNWFGLRYLSLAAIRHHPFLQFLIALFIGLTIWVALPLNLFAMLHAVLVLHFQEAFFHGKAFLQGKANVYEAGLWSIVITSILGFILTYVIRRRLGSIVDDRPMMRGLFWGGYICCILFLVPAALLLTTNSIERQRDATVWLKDQLVVGYGDATCNARWRAYQSVNVAGDAARNEVPTRQLRVPPEKVCSTEKHAQELENEKNLLKTYEIAPAGVYLAALYVMQPMFLLLQVVLSASILIYFAALWVGKLFYSMISKRQFTARSGLVMSIGALYAHWFFFAAFLFFVVPADIATDLALLSSLSSDRSGSIASPPIEYYRAYWFEIIPTVVLLLAALITSLIYYVFWKIGSTILGWRSVVSVSPAGKWLPRRRIPVIDSKTLVRPRFISPGLFMFFMFGLALIIHLGTIHTFHNIFYWLTEVSILGPNGLSGELFKGLCNESEGTFCKISLPLVTLIIFLVIVALVFGSYILRNGLKASLDVVNHFTPAAGVMGLTRKEKRGLTDGDYPLRRRIASRFKGSLQTLLSVVMRDGDQSSVDVDLVFIAHSQGTVILYDQLVNGHVLKLLSGSPEVSPVSRLQEGGVRASRVTIFTFGSPLTHIYQRYFQEDYPDMRADYPGEEDSVLLRSGAHFEHLRKLHELSKGDDPKVRWFNIYRVDDYVGTYIVGPSESFPKNIPLKPGGHTNYWPVSIDINSASQSGHKFDDAFDQVARLAREHDIF